MLLASKFVIFGIKRHRLLHHNTKCIISKHRFVCNNKFSPTLLSLNAVCECATVIGIACWANAFDRKWNGWHRKTITHEIYSHICRTTTRWRRITNRKWRKKKNNKISRYSRVNNNTNNDGQNRRGAARKTKNDSLSWLLLLVYSYVVILLLALLFIFSFAISSEKRVKKKGMFLDAYCSRSASALSRTVFIGIDMYRAIAISRIALWRESKSKIHKIIKHTINNG